VGLFHKKHVVILTRPEMPISPLYRNYNLGTTAFSALAGGLLTGKVRIIDFTVPTGV
jgi:aryl-alcohol dehydrogenase-like predicted oxidoreductase